jgi:hypothetical protein
VDGTVTHPEKWFSFDGMCANDNYIYKYEPRLFVILSTILCNNFACQKNKHHSQYKLVVLIFIVIFIEMKAVLKIITTPSLTTDIHFRAVASPLVAIFGCIVMFAK